MTSRWEQIEPTLREEAYRVIDSDPQVLLETDAGFSLDADVFFARLVGFDDEVVADWRINRIEPELYVPLMDRPTMASAEDVLYPTMPRRATYKLQSSYAMHTVQSIDGPSDVKPRPDFTIKVAYLRYRRRG